jgi:hypothetical protein
MASGTGAGTIPVVYRAIEKALRLFDLEEGNRWIANRLAGVNHPAAREAVRLLRQGEREEARRVLAVALLAMAGPSDGSGLGLVPARAPGRGQRRQGTALGAVGTAPALSSSRRSWCSSSRPYGLAKQGATRKQAGSSSSRR